MDRTPVWFGVYKGAKYALCPLSWIAIAGLLTLVTACLPVTPRRTTWGRRFALGTCLHLLLTATPLLSAMYIGLLEGWYPSFQATSISKFDAVVVLARGVDAKGSLRPVDDVSNASRQRTACDAALWLPNVAPKLLLTGGDATVSQTGLLESHEMKRWAQRLDISETAILVEENPGPPMKTPYRPRLPSDQDISFC